MPTKPRTEVLTIREVPEPAAYTMSGFAEAHGLSRGGLYNLLKAGLGPEVKRAGPGRVIIPREAAQKWRTKDMAPWPNEDADDPAARRRRASAAKGGEANARQLAAKGRG